MEPELCPECGANVEGLINRCDCCGARLNPKKILFSTMVYDTGVAHDIFVYLSPIFDKLNMIDPDPYSEVLQRIEFDFWCFRIKKKTGVAYYASRKRAIVTIELDIGSYVYGTKAEKMALLKQEVRDKMNMLHDRLRKKKIYIDDLFVQIDKALDEASCSTY